MQLSSDLYTPKSFRLVLDWRPTCDTMERRLEENFWQRMESDYPRPAWLALFGEGLRSAVDDSTLKSFSGIILSWSTESLHRIISKKICVSHRISFHHR